MVARRKNFLVQNIQGTDKTKSKFAFDFDTLECTFAVGRNLFAK